MTPPSARSARVSDHAPAERPAGAPLSESEVSEVVAGIGPRLRTLRGRLGLSLQQLAERSDVSPAAIHKVEQGTMVPTITTLLKLAAAFQVPVAHFIDETDAPATPVSFTPKNQRRVRTSPDGDVVVGSISAESGPFELTASITEMAAGAQSAPDDRRPAGEALVHVQSGTLELTVGAQTYRLSAGDSLHFRSEENHSWRNPSARTTKVVWVSLPERRG
ncbi:helix-turn-helix domain-containing protein [Kribbella sp. NBC_01484]|uniref:helix-turn-helix domain-containing protein n=1 Tax=Kribbella sp. NBC_01484 TaxID=2903579 RepID=UPI002E3669B9|nr:cupin domain-containing protein [Kribbella sp. NBC_01484]